MSDRSTSHSLGIVITGGSAGLGYALAEKFLEAGDRVVISGRNRERLDNAVLSLRRAVPQGELYGIGCDAGDPADANVLAEFASSRLGLVDRWINNAGTAGQLKRPLWELNSSDIFDTCTTNLAGSILQCAEAVRVMDRQPPSQVAVYHIFNMGFSSVGAALSRSAVPHKASKRAVSELTHFLSKELKTAGKTSIGVHELSPGLVLTALLLRDATPEAGKIFRIIAERPEKVAAVLVPKIRSISCSTGSLRYQPLAVTLLRLIGGLPQIIGG
jgi:NAD(P)-dependent dehydrogenase (short-subunit alcohol dehydrogenase family)